MTLAERLDRVSIHLDRAFEVEQNSNEEPSKPGDVRSLILVARGGLRRPRPQRHRRSAAIDYLTEAKRKAKDPVVVRHLGEAIRLLIRSLC